MPIRHERWAKPTRRRVRLRKRAVCRCIRIIVDRAAQNGALAAKVVKAFLREFLRRLKALAIVYVGLADMVACNLLFTGGCLALATAHG
jgi:hypothetical protein